MVRGTYDKKNKNTKKKTGSYFNLKIFKLCSTNFPQEAAATELQCFSALHLDFNEDRRPFFNLTISCYWPSKDAHFWFLALNWSH